MFSKSFFLISILIGAIVVNAAPVELKEHEGQPERRFYYKDYTLEKRSDEPSKRFYYTKYDIEKRSDEPTKRFLYKYDLEEHSDELKSE